MRHFGKNLWNSGADSFVAVSRNVLATFNTLALLAVRPCLPLTSGAWRLKKHLPTERADSSGPTVCQHNSLCDPARQWRHWWRHYSGGKHPLDVVSWWVMYRHPGTGSQQSSIRTTQRESHVCYVLP